MTFDTETEYFDQGPPKYHYATSEKNKRISHNLIVEEEEEKSLGT